MNLFVRPLYVPYREFDYHHAEHFDRLGVLADNAAPVPVFDRLLVVVAALELAVVDIAAGDRLVVVVAGPVHLKTIHVIIDEIQNIVSLKTHHIGVDYNEL